MRAHSRRGGGRRSETRTFSTMSRSLEVLRDWLLERGSVVGSLSSVSARAMLAALIVDEREPRVLADLAETHARSRP